MKKVTSEHPLVSVIIPTYSREGMLERALKSIANQTYPHVEIVVVDDNGIGTPSQLMTAACVTTFEKAQGVRCTYVRHEFNRGGAAARNTGIVASKGSLVSFLDDDDEYLPERLSKMVPALLAHEDAALVYSHCQAVYEDGATKDYVQTFNGCCLFEQATFGCICATSQWLCRRSVLLETGGFDLSPAKQDSIALYKMLLTGHSIYCVPEMLSIFYEHGGMRMSNGDKALAGEIQFDELIKKTMDRFNQHEKRLVKQAINLRLAKIHFRRGDYMRFLKKTLAAFALSPAKTMQAIGDVLMRNENRISYDD